MFLVFGRGRGGGCKGYMWKYVKRVENVIFIEYANRVWYFNSFGNSGSTIYWTMFPMLHNYY